MQNRIVLSPMCMYAAGEEGRANDWHLVHYGARAIGRCGLILTEATAVEPRGRISVNDLGLWSDDQVEPLARIVRFCHREGVRFGVQLGHAGRKAFSASKGRGPQDPVAPSAIPFAEGWVAPRELTSAELRSMVVAWREAARRAAEAGCDLIEIHGAHGYLLHQFLSPLSNLREDGYGGPVGSRARLHLEVVRAIRQVWPPERPILLRVSATDWTRGGLEPADLVSLVPALIEAGVDLIDCSSGGVVPVPPSPSVVEPGYQVLFAERIRREGGIPTAAVGLITEAGQADAVIREEKADLVAIGRELLRDAQWPLRAAAVLGAEVDWPRAYERGKWLAPSKPGA